MTVRDGKLSPGGIKEQCECAGEGEDDDVKVSGDDEESQEAPHQKEVTVITEDLQNALRAVIESNADEKAKIGCLAEAVRRALELVDPDVLEKSPALFKVLAYTERAGVRAEKKSLAGYVPNLGNQKLDEEYIGFIRSFNDVSLRRFLMACGKFKLGEKLTYKMIDAAQKEMSEGYTLSMVANFRYGDYLKTCSPFYFDIQSRGGRSEKGRKVTVMRLCKRRKR